MTVCQTEIRLPSSIRRIVYFVLRIDPRRRHEIRNTKYDGTEGAECTLIHFPCANS